MVVEVLTFPLALSQWFDLTLEATVSVGRDHVSVAAGQSFSLMKKISQHNMSKDIEGNTSNQYNTIQLRLTRTN